MHTYAVARVVVRSLRLRAHSFLEWQAILGVCDSSLGLAVRVTIFITSMAQAASVLRVWNDAAAVAAVAAKSVGATPSCSAAASVSLVQVASLPRGALVEFQVSALTKRAATEGEVLPALSAFPANMGQMSFVGWCVACLARYLVLICTPRPAQPCRLTNDAGSRRRSRISAACRSSLASRGKSCSGRSVKIGGSTSQERGQDRASRVRGGARRQWP